MLLLPSSEAGESCAGLLASLAQPTARCSLMRALLRLPSTPQKWLPDHWPVRLLSAQYIERMHGAQENRHQTGEKGQLPGSSGKRGQVQRILNEGYAQACGVLSEHYDQLTKLAAALLEHEQIDRTQFETLLRGHTIAQHASKISF